ncbi:MAG: ABC transporter substrate-binding protein [Acidimicrobiales bacterium]
MADTNRAVRPRRRTALMAALATGALGAALLTAPPAGAAQQLHKSSAPPLVVYSSEGYDTLVVRDFETKTGIPVHLETKPLASLAAQIQSTMSDPTWGVVWTDGPTVLATLDDEHLLVTHLKPTAAWNALGKRALPKDRSFVPTGVTLAAALLYTKTVVTSPPTSWRQLLQPKWKGQIAMTTPAQVGSTYPFLAGLIAQAGGTKDVAKGEKYFTRLKANGLVVHPSTGQTVQAVTSGKTELALLQSSVAVGAQHLDPKLAVSYLPSVTILPSTVAVDAKAPKKERTEAEKFIDYVLSQPGQNAMQAGTRYDESNYYPVVNGVQSVANLPYIGTIPTTSITPYVWAKRQTAITAWFVQHVAK